MRMRAGRASHRLDTRRCHPTFGTSAEAGISLLHQCRGLQGAARRLVPHPASSDATEFVANGAHSRLESSLAATTPRPQATVRERQYSRRRKYFARL
jgi:hypothetical protein